MVTRRAEERLGRGGARLHLAHTLPSEPARAHVVVVHGYGEHGGRYAELSEALARAGFAVHVPDLRGHGHSSGRRSLITDAEVLVDDLTDLLERLQAEPGPLALYGHSFGAALVLRAAQERPDLLDALVASAPYLVTALNDPPWLFRAAAWASHVLPWVRTRPLDDRTISAVPGEVRRYSEDPLVDRGGVPLASIREMHALGPLVLAEAANLVTPTLIVHGASDGLSDPEGSRRLARSAATADLTLRIVEGGFHDVLHDVEGDRVRTGIIDWLVDRLGLREATIERPAGA